MQQLTKPKEYQRECYKFIEQNGLRNPLGRRRSLISDEMGLGKTFEFLLWLYRNQDQRPAIVVCPAVLKYVWEREAHQHFGMTCEVLSGRRVIPFGFVKPDLIIVNYEVLQDWWQYLVTLQPKVICGDEVQYISSRHAKRTKAMQNLCQSVPHIILLSGTPLTNYPAELWPSLNILWPWKFPAFVPYAYQYCAPKTTSYGIDYRGVENLMELHHILKECGMIRRLKKDVFTQLSEKERVMVPLEITNKHEYDEAKDNFMVWMLKNYDKTRVNRAMKCERLVKLTYLLSLTARLKLQAVFKWIDNFLSNTDDKLVICAVNHEILDAIYNRFKEISIQADGRVIGAKRDAALEAFKYNKKYRLLEGQLKAIGTGWSASGINKTAVIQYGWSPGALLQVEDRTNGLNRGKEGEPSTYYYLMAHSTLEEWLIELIQKKQGTLNTVLDGIEDEEGLAFVIADELVAKMGAGS